MNELAVRQAIAFGTDRQRILDDNAPGSPLLDSFILPGSWSYPSSGLPDYGYNPLVAASILDEAGWVVGSGPDGFREKGGVPLHITIHMRNEPNRIHAAEIMKENMGAIGVDLELVIEPNIAETMVTHNFDIVLSGWIGDENADFSPDAGAWWIYKSDSVYNYGLYNNPEVDGLLDAINPLRTRLEVLPYAEQVQVTVMNDVASLPLYSMVTPPTADAGDDSSGLQGAMITLDGSRSTDPYADITRYEWDTDEDGLYDDAIGVTSEVSFDTGGPHTVNLKVTDAYGMFSTDSVVITITGCYSLTTVAFPFEAGSVEVSPAPNCGIGTYLEGTEVEVTSTSNPGYRFSHWSGDAVDTK